MKKALTHTMSVLALALLLLSAAVALAEDGGNVARVTYWTIRDGHVADFEAGLKAHNELHVAQNDPNALLTWQIVTGKRNGQYLRGSFGHDWADFDQDSATAEADAADTAKNIDPYIANDEPLFGLFMPELSNPVGGLAGVSRVIYFHVHPGKQAQFQGVIAKIHAALSEVEGGWPAYYWYEMATGSLPAYVVSLPRENWAGFAPSEPTLAAVLAAKYGEDTKKIFEALGDAVERQHSYISVFRADLSYLPAAD